MAGILGNICLAILYKIFNISQEFVNVNYLILFFNVLPIYPLDGFLILKTLFLHVYDIEYTNYLLIRISIILNLFFVILLFIYKKYFYILIFINLLFKIKEFFEKNDYFLLNKYFVIKSCKKKKKADARTH